MATSPNYGWLEPDNTDLVKNGALAIRTLGNAIDTTMATMVPKSIVDAKGDLIAGTAADTTSRLAVGSDYKILQALASEATGLTYGGGYTAYTPTWTATTTNPSLGNGTIVGGYRRIGDVVDFYFVLTMGTTTTFGTGSWRFTLPVAVADANNNYGYIGNALDSGTAWYSGLIGSGAIIPSTTTFGMRNTADTSSISSTVPFTWATNDVLLFKGSYKVN